MPVSPLTSASTASESAVQPLRQLLAGVASQIVHSIKLCMALGIK